MARIAGVDLPRTKRVEIGLTYIYGIGHTRAAGIVKEAGVDPQRAAFDLFQVERAANRIAKAQPQQAGALGGILALVGVDAQHLDVRAGGQVFMDTKPGGAFLAIDENGVAWAHRGLSCVRR